MACWLLLRYLTTSVDFQAEFSMQSGYAPVIESVYENDIYLEFLDNANGTEFITARANQVALEQEDWYYTSPAFGRNSYSHGLWHVFACAEPLLFFVGDRGFFAVVPRQKQFAEKMRRRNPLY